MAETFSTLRDIRGLDAVSGWPVAPAWWCLLAACVVLMLIVWYRHRRRWSFRVCAQLRNCQQRLRKEPPRRVLVAFSELMRRIAIAYHGRLACASLTGSAWLQWLQQHDPNGFDWSQKAPWLADLPYAPENHAGPSRKEIKRALRAAMAWVRRSDVPRLQRDV